MPLWPDLNIMEPVQEYMKTDETKGAYRLWAFSSLVNCMPLLTKRPLDDTHKQNFWCHKWREAYELVRVTQGHLCSVPQSPHAISQAHLTSFFSVYLSWWISHRDISALLPADSTIPPPQHPPIGSRRIFTHHFTIFIKFLSSFSLSLCFATALFFIFSLSLHPPPSPTSYSRWSPLPESGSLGVFTSHHCTVLDHKGSLECWGFLQNTAGSLPWGGRCCELLHTWTELNICTRWQTLTASCCCNKSCELVTLFSFFVASTYSTWVCFCIFFLLCQCIFDYCALSCLAL